MLRQDDCLNVCPTKFETVIVTIQIVSVIEYEVVIYVPSVIDCVQYYSSVIDFVQYSVSVIDFWNKRN